jgi:SAM-dependent methyltransferase
MPRTVRRAALAFSIRNRRRKCSRITRFIDEQRATTSLLVGCSGGVKPNEMIVERGVAAATTVVAALDVRPVTVPWPFVLGDARDLPFPDHSVDFLLANAVIEHVGDEEDQRRMVAEACRVASSFVITTPNRWFPVESHSSTLFRHWSSSWRAKRHDFTRLLSRREFASLLPPGTTIEGRAWSPTFMAFWSAPGMSAAAAVARTEDEAAASA